MHARGEMHGGIEVFPTAPYIVCTDGVWEVVELASSGPARTVECATLDEACDVVTNYF